MMRYLFLTKHRRLLLSALLGVSFFVENNLLFAQTDPFRCNPSIDSVSGNFTGDLTIPEDTVNTDILNQNRDFTIGCKNATTDTVPLQSKTVTATVIAPDLTANTPTMTGAGTGVANQFYEGTVTLSGALNNKGTADILAIETAFANQFQYRPTGTTSWNWLATVFLKDQSTDFPKQSVSPREVGSHAWTAGAESSTLQLRRG